MHTSHQATTPRVRLLSALVLTLALGAGAAQAERIRYVDNALPYTCNDRYDPAARRCGPGSETGFVNLRGATRADDGTAQGAPVRLLCRGNAGTDGPGPVHGDRRGP